MATIPDDARALLDGPAHAHVATLLPDGGPHSVPVWIGREGDHVAFFTQAGARKARNLERDPRIAVSVTDPVNFLVMAAMRGRVAQVLDGDAALEVVDRISVKYTGEPYSLREGLIAFLVEVETALAVAYG